MRNFAPVLFVMTLSVSAEAQQHVTYTARGTVTHTGPVINPAHLFANVQIGDAYEAVYRVDTSIPLNGDPIVSFHVNAGGVSSSLVGSSGVTISNDADAAMGLCRDTFDLRCLTTADYGRASLQTTSTNFVMACPSYLTDNQFPLSLDLSQLGAGSAVFSVQEELFTSTFIFVGQVESLDVSWGGADSFLNLCSGDGGDQLGCTDCPCGNNAALGTVGGCLNSVGTSTQLAAMGADSIALGTLSFGAYGAPPGATAVLLSGSAVAPLGAGSLCLGLDSGAQSAAFDGLRCAVQGVLRHGARVADANGEVGGLGSGWGPVSSGFINFGAFVAGGTRYFQVVHRDDPALSCMRGLNTSQAVKVTFAP